jgi:hypothetical protein|tara:strand:- start:18 stop:191 length:174 start_codon:yes stop_codon:yes gene_type:complete
VAGATPLFPEAVGYPLGKLKWERCFSEEKFQVSGCSLSSASYGKVPEEAVPVPEYVD